MKLVRVAVALGVLLPGPGAIAGPFVAGGELFPDPGLDVAPLHIMSDSTLTTDGGSELRLPPGYYLTEPQWEGLDREIERLQDAETRLGAENKSLRASPGGWGWVVIGVLGVGVGFALGTTI